MLELNVDSIYEFSVGNFGKIFNANFAFKSANSFSRFWAFMCCGSCTCVILIDFVVKHALMITDVILKIKKTIKIVDTNPNTELIIVEVSM